MKKIYLLIFLSFFVFACSDSHYVAEKLLWQAEKNTKELLKNKSNRLSSDDYEKIISYYREVTERVPLDTLSSKAHFFITDILLREGKYEEARKELRVVINNFSSSGAIASQAYFAIGRIFESQGKWEEAKEEYDKIIDLYPLTNIGLNLPLYIVQHYTLKNNNKEKESAYRKALRHYKGLIEEYKDTSVVPLVKDYLARAKLNHGNLEEALSVWDEIKNEYSASPLAIKALFTKARLYERELNDKKQAIKEYQEFIEKYTNHKTIPEVKFKIAMLFLEDSQVTKAKDIFGELLRDYSSDSKLCIKSILGLALCYRKEADTEKVISAYQKIKKEYPQSKAALSVPFLIGQYYLEEKYNSKASQAFQEAIREYKKKLEEAKDNILYKREIANLLALCYLKNNQIEEAIKMLNSLAERYSKEPVYLIDLATLYRILNNKEKAIEVYEKLIKRFPKNPTVLKLAYQQIEALRSEE